MKRSGPLPRLASRHHTFLLWTMGITPLLVFLVLCAVIASCLGYSPARTSASTAPLMPISVQKAGLAISATLLGFSLSTADSLQQTPQMPSQVMDIDVFKPRSGEHHPRFARISYVKLTPSSAHADSTGKMSTKLTARKRYLPRIKEGVSKFNALSTDKAVADEFFNGSGDKKPGVDNFTRAMSLYGASLRVGETPDKISREAEQLTADFTKQVMKAKANPTKEALAPAAAKLKEYIAFAETHSVTPIDHYQVD